MDFDNRKVYDDTSITDGLVLIHEIRAVVENDEISFILGLKIPFSTKGHFHIAKDLI